MEFQVPSSASGSIRMPTDHPQVDMENSDRLLSEPPQACDNACQNLCHGPVESAFGDTLGRAPPRVDSCPDMDTRPPLTPDLICMDLDAQLEDSGHGYTFHMQELLSELPMLDHQKEQAELGLPNASHCKETLNGDAEPKDGHTECAPCPLHIVTGKGLAQGVPHLSESSTMSSSSLGLFRTESASGELMSLFQCEDGSLAQGEMGIPLARLESVPRNQPPSLHSLQDQVRDCLGWNEEETTSSSSELSREDSSCSLAELTEPAWTEYRKPPPSLQESEEDQKIGTPELSLDYPTPAKVPVVPGPCEPEDLLDGVIFGAKYLGSTQLQYEKNPATNTRMRQAQEAVDRVKAPEGESQPMTEVDVMVSTQRVKVLTADSQEALMDHPLQTISYTADIGSIVVIMARRKSPRSQEQPSGQKRSQRMLCHVFQSADAQMIAQAIGQAFGLAYQNFLLSEGGQPVTSGATEQLYNADLAYFSKRDNCREVYIQKQRGEVLGVAVVESGWGSLLPTVVIANLMHGGPAERSGELSIGDHVTSINGTSLVGLPLSTSQGLIRELKGQSEVVLNIVRCPPVITAIIHRPDASHPLGFCVEDGVICSLVRGGIAERGGIRVGHRIIEINGQSVVATSHEKIIQTLLDATGEVHIKTMPASTYRLLTGQETPLYL
ncbi:amyloid-beta A4 precursor protein-binding family A member 3 [Pelobates fuscus]|uniref:amyloid-beta A4 precursor protein-binding family A member 3 n=1 Tax=Pelobates fuscus TaxID=191477 RepID=UPI002FE46B63